MLNVNDVQFDIKKALAFDNEYPVLQCKFHAHGLNTAYKRHMKWQLYPVVDWSHSFPVRLLLSRTHLFVFCAAIAFLGPLDRGGGGALFACFPFVFLSWNIFVVFQFLKSSVVDLKDFFSGLEYDSNFYDGRVDPLEPSRVWLTTRLFGKVVGPIEGFGLKVKAHVLY